VFNLGAYQAAFEVGEDGAPCVVFAQGSGDDLAELLTLAGAVLEKLSPPDDRPVTISRNGSGVVLTVGELGELQARYTAAIGLLESYQGWLTETVKRQPVTIALPCYCPA